MIPDSHKDLLQAEVGVLATNGADGHPQVTALWFLYEEAEGLRLSLNTARQKVKNLRADGRCTFFIMEPGNPYRTLELRTQATITPDENYTFAKRMATKYGGVDFAEMDGPDGERVVVTLEVVKANTWGEAREE